MPHYPFSGKDDLKTSFWMNILFGRVVVGCGVNQMIIRFSEASILPSVRFFIRPFLRKIVCAAWNLRKEYIYTRISVIEGTAPAIVLYVKIYSPNLSPPARSDGQVVQYILQTQH